MLGNQARAAARPSRRGALRWVRSPGSLTRALVALTTALAAASAWFIANDYTRGPRSEFNWTGLGGVVIAAAWVAGFLVFGLVGLLVRLLSKDARRGEVLRACGLSLPIVALLLLGAFGVAEWRTAQDHARRCPDGACAPPG